MLYPARSAMQTHCQAFYIQSIGKNTLNADLLIKPFAEKEFPCLFVSERNVEFPFTSTFHMTIPFSPPAPKSLYVLPFEELMRI